MLQRDLDFKNKFHFTSLGCARNLVDTEVMIGLLLKAGYEITTDLAEADYLVINTCGFLEASRQEGLDTIGEMFQKKKEGAKVIVAGCMVQKHKHLIESQFPDVHAYVGTGSIEKIVDAVQTDTQAEWIGKEKSYLEWGEVPRMLTTPKHYAYLKIAEGCKKRCAFCIIPTIKGPLKSKSTSQVVSEFRSLLAQGVFEVILIAQDLGDFGKDRKEKRALHALLQELLKIEEPFWLRLLYLYPDEIDDELIAIMKSDPRICPYLDMPIQHIADPMLKAMHRTTSSSEIKTILAKLRSEIPHISIRTSLMVGFPGETDAMFEELIDFVMTTELDNVGIFQFSKEEEAYAARLPDQIDPAMKQKRFDRLARAQQKALKKWQKKWVGQTLSAIVEGPHPDSPYLMRARHAGQCPDIDGQIIINDGRLVDAYGPLYQVEITDVAGYDLIGQVVTKERPWKKQGRLALI
ncbi:MAG: hypothetical protein RL235_531 [Chlamydiota bacterium]|jgi:ribosomal protein S12 methylthiotransferase